jgi:Holliday junction resolvasome RuvABC endonuclease subunit
MIFSFDFGTKTGYAILTNEGKLIASGCIDLEDKHAEEMYSKDFNWSPRYSYLLDNFESLKAYHGTPDIFAFEKPMGFFSGSGNRKGTTSDTVIKLNTLANLGAMWAYRQNLVPFTLHSNTLKKWSTGNGFAKKPQMLKEASKRFGFEVKNDNEADALLLAKYTLESVLAENGVSDL